MPLKDIVDFEVKESPTSIRRSSQNRYIEVSAAIADGYNVGLVSQELQKNWISMKCRKDMNWS